jgi:hypothetical protein
VYRPFFKGIKENKKERISRARMRGKRKTRR